MIDVFLPGGRGVGGVETLERAWTVVRLRRGAEVADAKLIHELLDERRTPIAHEPLPAPELVGVPIELDLLEQRSFEQGVAMHRYAIRNAREASSC